MSCEPRLNRLFGKDGKCFDVAVDHGMFNAAKFLNGIEDMGAAVNTIVEASPDAVQLTPGQAHFLQGILDKKKPAFVLRTDIANCYDDKLPEYLYSNLISEPIETAVRLDAACVVVNLLLLPNQPDLHRQCIENISTLKGKCEKYGMPLMIEPLVMLPNEEKGGYMVDGNIDKIKALVRQAVELGADLIKADPCDDPEEYDEVIEVASGVPLLVRGGGRVSDEEVLKRTHVLMQKGAAGIVYGRAVVHHPDPNGMTRALMSIVHDSTTPEEAIKHINKN